MPPLMLALLASQAVMVAGHYFDILILRRGALIAGIGLLLFASLTGRIKWSRLDASLIGTAVVLLALAWFALENSGLQKGLMLAAVAIGAGFFVVALWQFVATMIGAYAIVRSTRRWLRELKNAEEAVEPLSKQ